VTGGVAHVLLDADGVVQFLPGGWEAALQPFLGDRAEDFVTALAMDEAASLRGTPFLPVLARILEDFEVAGTAEEVYAAAWERIAVAASTVPLVESLRARGLGVHLATNQNPERAAYMRRALGYGELFDSCFYSCEIGAAKPEAAYFEHALAALGAPAGAVLFIDDAERNVEGARSVGLRAERWHLSEGEAALSALLSAHLS
jgi:putative hydrolase of the HAD superfamily